MPHNYTRYLSKELNPDKNQNLIVYCSAGKRSTQARELLVYRGYKNVYVLTDHNDYL